LNVGESGSGETSCALLRAVLQTNFEGWVDKVKFAKMLKRSGTIASTGAVLASAPTACTRAGGGAA
jgi:hypothetical protein